MNLYKLLMMLKVVEAAVLVHRAVTSVDRLAVEAVQVLRLLQLVQVAQAAVAVDVVQPVLVDVKGLQSHQAVQVVQVVAAVDVGKVVALRVVENVNYHVLTIANMGVFQAVHKRVPVVALVDAQLPVPERALQDALILVTLHVRTLALEVVA